MENLNGATGASNNANDQHIRIVDANNSLLREWKSRTAATGMEYLRSSAGFHLDRDEHALRRHFGVVVGVGKKKRQKKKKSPASQGGMGNRKGVFAKDYERPRLDAFNQHCDSVVTKYNLDQLHVEGIVTSIEPVEDHVKVVVSCPLPNNIDTDDGSNHAHDIETKSRISRTYTAQNVVLALGNDEPSYPEWVDEEDIAREIVRHLLDDRRPTKLSHNITSVDADTDEDTDHVEVKDVAVIGGGITAAHKVLELVRTARTHSTRDNTKRHIDNTIHLISRHPLKEQQFDTHQDWMMDRATCRRSEEVGGVGTPDCQETFRSCNCWEERRRIIARERIPGTVTPAIHRGEGGLSYAIDNGNVEWHHAEVLKKRYVGVAGQRKRIELSLSCGNTIEVDEVLLATGFGKKLPGGKLIKDLIEKYSLEVSDFCGFPIVDENLSWRGSSQRIYVTGALAELELGPSARNIAGARLAAERILQAAAVNV
mmetsp:Transcript_60649/g.71992  ORF Transcript_60649/g.71992 Transcript_60649/m.71992 type:complete len:483 (+) Transcript_60649:264-1712(+)